MFRPAETPRRVQCGHPLAYYVAKNSNSFALTLRMTRALAHSAGIKHGDPVRIDIGSDSDSGTVRLTKVASSTRHWYGRERSSQSLYINATWSGDLENAFPYAPKITGLEVIDISREDGITLKCPAPQVPAPTPPRS